MEPVNIDAVGVVNVLVEVDVEVGATDNVLVASVVVVAVVAVVVDVEPTTEKTVSVATLKFYQQRKYETGIKMIHLLCTKELINQ